MKYLLFALLALSSCTKERECYDCDFVNSLTGEQSKGEYCGEMPHEFTDGQGNDLISHCRKR